MKNTFESPSSPEQLVSRSYFFSLADERHPETNEDSYFSDDNHKTYGVFDGVGGSEGASYASKFVADIVQHYPNFQESKNPENIEDTKNYFCEMLKYAHDRLILERENRPQFQEMDTTAAIVKILKTENGAVALALSTGDSRVYSFRSNRKPPLVLHTLDDGVIKQKYMEAPSARKDAVSTKEDAVEDAREKAMKAQEYFDYLQRTPTDPVEADLFERRNLISNSIGILRDVRDVEVSIIDVQDGDILLLTTDGIHDPLTKQEISDTISKNIRSLHLIPQSLALKANRVNGFRRKLDDRTAVVVKIG